MFRARPVVLLAAWLLPAAVDAFPKFAQKEGKPCAHCHVRPKGGGKRNAAGAWYETHNFTFDGYRPGKPPGKPSDKKKPAQPKPKGKKT